MGELDGILIGNLMRLMGCAWLLQVSNTRFLSLQDHMTVGPGLFSVRFHATPACSAAHQCTSDCSFVGHS